MHQQDFASFPLQTNWRHWFSTNFIQPADSQEKYPSADHLPLGIHGAHWWTIFFCITNNPQDQANTPRNSDYSGWSWDLNIKDVLLQKRLHPNSHYTPGHESSWFHILRSKISISPSKLSCVSMRSRRKWRCNHNSEHTSNMIRRNSSLNVYQRITKK